MKITFVLILCILGAFAQRNGGRNGRGRRPDGDRPDGGRPDGDRPDGGRPDGGRPDGGDSEAGDRPQPPQRPPRVQCRARRTPTASPEDATYGEVCEVTQSFEAFLGTIAAQPACDGLFTGRGEEEYAAFCHVINQTVNEFANIPDGSNANPVDWTDASFDFPDVCGGRAPTICAVCRTIRDAFVAAPACGECGNCQFGKCVDWTALTRSIVDDVFDQQEDCAAIRGRGRGQGAGYGYHVCNYVLSTNDDFTCAAWANFVAGCEAQGIDDAETCFQTYLTSTLIQTAALTLHTSNYCESIRGRALSEVLV